MKNTPVEWKSRFLSVPSRLVSRSSNKVLLKRSAPITGDE